MLKITKIKNDTGSVVHILLFVVVIAAALIFGYLRLKHASDNKKATNSDNTASQNVVAEKPFEIPVGWYTEAIDNSPYTISYPAEVKNQITDIYRPAKFQLLKPEEFKEHQTNVASILRYNASTHKLEVGVEGYDGAISEQHIVTKYKDSDIEPYATYKDMKLYEIPVKGAMNCGVSDILITIKDVLLVVGINICSDEPNPEYDLRAKNPDGSIQKDYQSEDLKRDALDILKSIKTN